MSESPLTTRHSPLANLDADVRRYDEDRWLASRFAPTDVRARLVVIYALNHEIARSAEVVSTPALADIRLAWWREAIGEIHAGAAPRSHPTLQAYAEIAPLLSSSPWMEITEARRTLERFTSWESVEAFIERTSRAVMKLAIAAIDDAEGADAVAPILTDAARAWGYIALLRSSAFQAIAPGPAAEALKRASAAYQRVHASAVRPPARLFPAVGYVALVPGYLRAIERDGRDRPLLPRQLRLIAAAAMGRL